jgi:hypothetical protein
MGYGHRRAVHPLRGIAEDGILVAGKNDGSSAAEQALWERMLHVYESFSRVRGVPVIGKPLFGILDLLMQIPSYYPMRDLSKSTFQVELLLSFLRQGLCAGILERIRTRGIPVVSSFYAPAIAADIGGHERVYCIICDADLNRVWVAKQPWESGVNYFAPCGRAAQRLKTYGVPEERILLTGFPLPEELLGDSTLNVLRKDLGQRLVQLDPNRRFWRLHAKSVEHFLGPENCGSAAERPLTITYAVGGAGAQREVGERIARSLRSRLASGEMRLNLVAGVRQDVREYFERVRSRFPDCRQGITVLYGSSMEGYFDRFNALMRQTDLLWTKPSELSFFSGLGIPIIMSPTIGSQEKFNRRWLFEVQAGIRQENPDYTDQWLFDLINDGRLAEAAWDGFLKARKLGTRKIREVLTTGTYTRGDSPLER